jgi:uncharacterized protein YggE
MSQSVRTFGALALGALVVAVAALSAHTGPTTAAPVTANDPATHTISVSASGKVTVAPDVARVILGVTITKTTVRAARSSAAGAMTKIIASAKALGIAEADIKTVGLSLYPQYGSGSRPKIVGYTISNQVQITIRDIDKAGDVVDKATANGATDVNGISFELADPDKAMNDARASAVAAAQVSAQAMATAGHVTLGAVVSISDTNPAMPVYYGGAMRSMSLDAAVPTPVQAGAQDVSVQLTVVFEIV